MECGGKRSATPLWLRVALLLHQRITAVRESGGKHQENTMRIR
jgi:hypothetical protein